MADEKAARESVGRRRPYSTHFSRNLTVLRKMSGLTQREAAGLMGFPEKSYQSWEYGYSKPSRLEFFIRICEFFNMYDLYALFSRRLTSAELGTDIEDIYKTLDITTEHHGQQGQQG